MATQTTTHENEIDWLAYTNQVLELNKALKKISKHNIYNDTINLCEQIIKQYEKLQFIGAFMMYGSKTNEIINEIGNMLFSCVYGGKFEIKTDPDKNRKSEIAWALLVKNHIKLSILSQSISILYTITENNNKKNKDNLKDNIYKDTNHKKLLEIKREIKELITEKGLDGSFKKTAKHISNQLEYLKESKEFEQFSKPVIEQNEVKKPYNERIFKSHEAFVLFEEYIKSIKKNETAETSFLFRQMTKDDMIYESVIHREYFELLHEYNITSSKIKAMYQVKNPLRINLYQSLKDRYYKK